MQCLDNDSAVCMDLNKEKYLTHVSIYVNDVLTTGSHILLLKTVPRICMFTCFAVHEG